MILKKKENYAYFIGYNYYIYLSLFIKKISLLFNYFLFVIKLFQIFLFYFQVVHLKKLRGFRLELNICFK